MISHEYIIVLVDRANSRNIIETQGNTAQVIRYLNSNRYRVLSIRSME
jgi:hypothetical protein